MVYKLLVKSRLITFLVTGKSPKTKSFPNLIVVSAEVQSGDAVSSSYLKWAGGKSKVAPILLEKFTKTGRLCREDWIVSDERCYHEWFSGSFSMYFALKERGFISNNAENHLNDFSQALINSARVIKKMTSKTIFKQLEQLRTKYITSLGGKEIPRNETPSVRNKRYYYEIRKEFNILNRILTSKKKLSQTQELRLCCLMIFLNKTCFNGIYRVNKKGDMNVPEGDYPELPTIRTEKEIINCARLLENSHLYSGDWKEVAHLAKKGDLIYIDPPYAKSSKKNGFTTYSTKAFLEFDQIEVAKEACRLVKEKGCRVIASNSGTKWVRDMYKEAANDAGVQILFRHIMVARPANRNGKGRGKVPELLIFIFSLNHQSNSKGD